MMASVSCVNSLLLSHLVRVRVRDRVRARARGRVRVKFVVAPDGVALVLVREDRELVPHGCDVGHSDDGRRVLDVMGGCRGTQGGRTTSRRSPPRATGLRCA